MNDRDDKIIFERRNQLEGIEKAGYSINKEVEKLSSIYLQMVNNTKNDFV